MVYKIPLDNKKGGNRSNTRQQKIVRILPVLSLPILMLVGCITPPESENKLAVSESVATAMSGDGFYAMCDGKNVKLENIVGPAINNMLTQGNPQPATEPKIWEKVSPEPGIRYTQVPSLALQDCSGSFLRVVSQVAASCPEHEAKLPIDAGVPAYSKATDGTTVDAGMIRARTTQSTAQWYKDNGLFTPVYCDGNYMSFTADLKAAEKLLHPGAVVWYGKGESCSTKDAGETALINNINHMGTVLSVERNDAGEVQSYKIYHGRNKGKGSGINTLEREYQGSSKVVPPFGNWTEPVVGIAPIVPVAGGSAGAIP